MSLTSCSTGTFMTRTFTGFKPVAMPVTQSSVRIAAIQARSLVKHPENISFEEAAASWMQYVTAWGALVEQAMLKQSDFVIVTAASSSVGIAAIQVAGAVGATVIATTRTSAKRKALLDNRAHHVIATEEEDLVKRVMEITHGLGARVIFDPVGAPPSNR
jgi:NADPH:quinone reductase-like Zn-dependent oxidoreductase